MYELVGYRYCEIEAKSKGEQDLKGYSCHFLMDEIDKDFVGRSGVKVFFSDEKFPDFVNAVNSGAFGIGSKFLLVFNQKGKLQAYQKLDG